jgi:diacylglycerol kinase (ATP)
VAAPEHPLVLFNPSAGGGRAMKKKEALEAALAGHGIGHELVVTKSEADLRERAGRGARSGRAIVAAGGDSTFHIVVNAIMEAGRRVPLGLVGVGSSNDIALEFGLETLEKACLALKRRRVKRVDLGLIRPERGTPVHFLGQANIGLGATVNRYVARLAERKKSLARRQTLAGVLGILDAYRTRKVPVRLRIASPEEELAGPFILAVFSNIRFWATGKVLHPGAKPDDGKLDACLFRDCSFARLVRLNSLANRGRHAGCRGVEVRRAVSFEVSADEPFLVQTDGEMLREPSTNDPLASTRARFEIVPGALDLIF